MDGFRPVAALIEGSDRALYGTSPQGGANNSGTVFKLNQDGSAYAILHSFKFFGDEGDTPVGALVQGSDGALYGTAAYGGTQSGASGCGKHLVPRV